MHERPEEQVARIWAGTDIGKTHHHCVVLDVEGKRLLSRRVLNDEPELLSLLADVLALGEDVIWAVDVADGMAALWVNILLNHGQRLVYIPGLGQPRCRRLPGNREDRRQGCHRHRRPGQDAP
jgi:hypothetical protein